MTFEPSAQPPELSAEATPAESPPNAAPPPESAARSTAQQDPSSPATESPTESTPSPPESARPIASSGTGSFNPAAVNPLDWGILAAGFLALVFSFVSYYTATAKSPRLAGTYTASTTAWHGFFGWFAVLVALASAVLLAVHIFLPKGGIPELRAARISVGRIRACFGRRHSRCVRNARQGLGNSAPGARHQGRLRPWCRILAQSHRDRGGCGHGVPAPARVWWQSSVETQQDLSGSTTQCPSSVRRTGEQRRLCRSSSDTVARIVTGVPPGTPAKE